MKNQMLFSDYVSFVGPALLVSIGYMDPGNWATAIEGGSRFGYELVWTIVLSNLSAVLLQFLAARLGLVTGKHLAQICHDEYPRPVCISLWLLCEASLVALDMAMILGTASGLNLLLGLPILVCVLLVAMDMLFLIFILPFLGVHKAELIPVSIIGGVLLCVVSSALSSKPSPSAVISGLIPRFKWDSLYITVSLLGANIAPHNLYLRSALVLVQKKACCLSTEERCKRNLIEILIALGAAILVNLAISLAAAAMFHNTGLVLFTLQDAHVLMQHVLSNSVSSLAFGLALLCAGQLSTLTGTIIGQVVTEGFLGANIDAWLHRLIVRAVAVTPGLWCAWKYGSEGIYQMLIFSQCVLVLQLPFMAVPLIKATSHARMNSYKNTVLVEIFVWMIVAFAFILNVSLVLNLLVLEADVWLGSTSWEYGGGFSWLHMKFGQAINTVFIASGRLVVGLLVSFFLWLVFTPLKGSSCATKELIWTKNCNLHMSTERELKEPENVPTISENDSSSTANLVSESKEVGVTKSFSLIGEGYRQRQDCEQESSRIKEDLSQSVEACHPEIVDKQLSRSSKEKQANANIPRLVMSAELSHDTDTVINQLTSLPLEPCHKENPASTFFPPTSLGLSGSSEVVSSLEPTLKQSSFAIGNSRGKPLLEDLDTPALKEAEAEADAEFIDKDDDDVDEWENLEHEGVVADFLSDIGGSLNSLPYDGPESGRSIGGRSDTSEGGGGGGGSGSGSLSRLSGLGRAARRQFASILDEFWGKLFDLHGQTLPRSAMKSEVLATNTRIAHAGRPQLAAFQEGPERQNVHDGATKQGWRAGYRQSFVSQPPQANSYIRSQSNAYASTSDCFTHGLPQDPYASGSPYVSYTGQRRYSGMRYPSFQEEVDHPPATVHGYGAVSNRRTNTLTVGPKARPLHLDVQFLHSNYSSSFREPVTEPSLGHLFPTTESIQLEPKSLDINSLRTDPLPFDSFTQSYVTAETTLNSFVSGVVTNSHFGDQSFSFRDLNQQQQGDAFCSSSISEPLPQRASEKWNPLVYRATGELDIGFADFQTTLKRNKNFGSSGRSPIGRGSNAGFSASHVERTPLAFDQIAPSQMQIEGFSLRTSSKSDNHSLWSRQPFEQLFGAADFSNTKGSRISGNPKVVSRPDRKVFRLPNGVEFGIDVLESLRVCIAKLLQLEGSDWLFRVDNGADEDLVTAVAAHEKFLLDSDASNSSRNCTSSDNFIQQQSEPHDKVKDLVLLRQVPHCGNECIWGSCVLISFGVWCIHRVLELSLMESRPELWGKYTYVLNHLQGILEPAFGRPRSVPLPCICVCSNTSNENHRKTRYGNSKEYVVENVSQSYPYPWPWGRNTTNPKGKPASGALFVDMIKEVEAAVGSRKGRTGTAAGDVAFPKGKENLASVLKRYKRRLGNKSGNASGSGSVKRDTGLSPASFLLLLYML